MTDGPWVWVMVFGRVVGQENPVYDDFRLMVGSSCFRILFLPLVVSRVVFDFCQLRMYDTPFPSYFFDILVLYISLDDNF